MENVGGGDEISPPEESAPAVEPEEGGAHAGAPSIGAKSRALILLSGAVLIGLAFWWLQFSTQSICCGDFDAYYHFRWSQMLWEGLRTGSFPPAFTALPLTTLNPRDYVDHHLLFHVMQIPFTWFGDFRLGAKWGTWFFACAAVFSCFWLLVRYRVSYPLLWLLAIIGSAAPFLYRIQMGKAMSVSIVLLVVGIHLLFRRQYFWLLPLAFIFALTYDMFVLLVVATGFWALVVLWSERRLEWRPVAFVLVGSALGFVINPYFPHNVELLFQHALMKITPRDFTVPVGGEWYPYSTLEFLGNCLTAFAAMIVAYVAFRDSTRKEMQRPLFFLLFATFLMLVNMRWRRFSEYWPPFAILFAAFALHPHVLRLRVRHGVAPAGAGLEEGAALVPGDPAPDAGRTLGPREIERARTWEFALVGALAVVLAAPAVWYVNVTSKDIEGMAGPEQYRGGMEWVSKNAEPGELIFNTDWDDFPKLFFYGPQYAYVSGLDPTYLYDSDRRLADLYAKIGIGRDLSDEEVDDLGPLVRDNFCYGEGQSRRCVRYVFSDRHHEDFYNNALDSGWFDVVYEDEDSSVLRIRDVKGDPVPDNVPVGGQGDDSPGGDAPEPEGAGGDGQP